MELPLSAQPILCHFDFGSQYVQISSANSTATIVSALDQISGLGALQTTIASQPTFSLSQFGVPAFYHGAKFDGSNDSLGFNSLASKVATLNSFTIFVVAKTASPASTNQDLVAFGKGTSGDGYTRVGFSGSAAFFSDKNDAAVVASGTGGTVDTNTHLYTLVNANGTLSLRLDGTQVASSAVSGAHTYTTLTFAALANNSTTANFANATIYEIAIYAGKADLTAVENYFSNKYLQGINREV